MNRYRTEFFARCPVNGIRIKYTLCIEAATPAPISVEEIIECVEGFTKGFHEDIADVLWSTFGGKQTLVAEHHGVVIETERPWNSCHPCSLTPRP